MSDTTELNDKLVSELREMEKSLGIAEADELRKPQLISRIVEQNQLIEAARAQQNAVENNYSEIKTTAPAAAVENGERTRKRIRVKTNSTEPRVEVPLDDTNLFDLQDDEPQQEETENQPEEAAKPEVADEQNGESVGRD